ncbi:MAG: DNA/RNA nuclease SfsA [Bdellovibrionaceae bacterium]|nr:DNA/RNA nuclease SfsA [Bdellovibrio sp.]
MKFHTKLTEGNLIQRYKRFFADVEYIDPQTNKKIELTIHVPNTGSLKSVIEKPSQMQKCWFSLSNDPNRKLKGTLEAVQTIEGAWVGVNTSHPNKITHEAIQAALASQKSFFKHWAPYKYYKSEHKISKETRLDGVFCVDESDLDNHESKKHFIEIKNTTLMKVIDGKKHAQFPDAVTERGQKHLKELTSLVKAGHQAELIFTVQRSDVTVFSIAHDIDPDYKKLFDMAVKAGVIISPVLVELNQHSITLSKKFLSLK